MDGDKGEMGDRGGDEDDEASRDSSSGFVEASMLLADVLWPECSRAAR